VLLLEQDLRLRLLKEVLKKILYTNLQVCQQGLE
jgi:hypothetical protein